MSTNLITCPCGSGHSYDNCCEPIIKGLRNAATAEELMRARYTAYTVGEIDFLLESTIEEERKNCNREEMLAWSKNSIWKGFTLIATEKGGPDDDEGTVEFIARYSNQNNEVEHHELSLFRKVNGKWYFCDGKMVSPKPYVRETPKVGPNDPCPCGSGKKFKKCCGR